MSSRSSLPDDPRLAEVARTLEPMGWALMLSDAKMRLVWVSEELKHLIGERDEGKLGYGRHVLEAWTSDTWCEKVTQESQVRNFLQAVRYMIPVTEGGKDAIAAIFGEQFQPLLDQVEPEDPPLVHADWFEFLRGDLPPAKIRFIVVTLVDNTGEVAGFLYLYNSALAARLVDLLARGDERMYERMAKLVEPGRRRAAILFADLQSSATLSRRLPSAAYFRLMSSITTAIDQVVIDHDGIVGKHAGDGVTAFFLEDDTGSASAAARAALHAARGVGEAAAQAAKEVANETGLFDPEECRVNVGVHWGATLYMGQLITGGRLEVTALGDEVNECARIQETARDGQALASKTLIEHLTREDAAAVGINPDSVVYRTVSEIPGAPGKAARDAGAIPVTSV